MVAAHDDQPRGDFPLVWLVAFYLAALAANLYVFWILPSASVLERLAFSLQLIGVYNLALTFLSQADVSKGFSDWLGDTTSADLRSFLAGALRILSIFALLSSLTVRGFPPPLVTRRLPLLLQVLVVLTFGLGFALFVVVFFALAVPLFLIGIVPLAYIGYVLVDILLDAVSNAANDRLGPEEVAVKVTVLTHQAQLRTALVGVPATALGVATAGIALLT
jgi:hypothetical protein